MDEPNHNDFEAPIFGWLEGILFACGDAVDRRMAETLSWSWRPVI